jgi:hypothetical protein
VCYLFCTFLFSVTINFLLIRIKIRPREEKEALNHSIVFNTKFNGEKKISTLKEHLTAQRRAAYVIVMNPVVSWRLKRWIEEMPSEGDFNGAEKSSVWHCDELEN